MHKFTLAIFSVLVYIVLRADATRLPRQALCVDQITVIKSILHI